MKCRCGSSLAYSSEDIVTGQPAEGCDYFCLEADPEKGPHDWGVVVYEDGQPIHRGVKS
jgi:hypothetical protein